MDQPKKWPSTPVTVCIAAALAGIFIMWPAWKGRPLSIPLAVGIFAVIFAGGILWMLTLRSKRETAPHLTSFLGALGWTGFMYILSLIDSYWIDGAKGLDSVISNAFLCFFAGGAFWLFREASDRIGTKQPPKA